MRQRNVRPVGAMPASSPRCVPKQVELGDHGVLGVGEHHLLVALVREGGPRGPVVPGHLVGPVEYLAGGDQLVARVVEGGEGGGEVELVLGGHVPADKSQPAIAEGVVGGHRHWLTSHGGRLPGSGRMRQTMSVVSPVAVGYVRHTVGTMTNRLGRMTAITAAATLLATLFLTTPAWAHVTVHPQSVPPAPPTSNWSSASRTSGTMPIPWPCRCTFPPTSRWPPSTSSGTAHRVDRAGGHPNAPDTPPDRRRSGQPGGERHHLDGDRRGDRAGSVRGLHRGGRPGAGDAGGGGLQGAPDLLVG